MKFTVNGTVRELFVRRRWLLFTERFLLIEMDVGDIVRIEREVNAHFPGYGALGSTGCAVDIDEHGLDPAQFPPDTVVRMTAVIGNAVENFFMGIPPLQLRSIQPLATTG